MMLSILEGFLEEGREMVSPLRNPIVRQDKSCHGADVATGQPSLCGGQGTPQRVPLLAAPFWALQKVAGRLICHGAFPGAITHNYISLRTDGLSSNFISAQVCVFTQD